MIAVNQNPKNVENLADMAKAAEEFSKTIESIRESIDLHHAKIKAMRALHDEAMREQAMLLRNIVDLVMSPVFEEEDPNVEDAVNIWKGHLEVVSRKAQELSESESFEDVEEFSAGELLDSGMEVSKED